MNSMSKTSIHNPEQYYEQPAQEYDEEEDNDGYYGHAEPDY